jgi:hypothetical protein
MQFFWRAIFRNVLRTILKSVTDCAEWRCLLKLWECFRQLSLIDGEVSLISMGLDLGEVSLITSKLHLLVV